MVRQVTDTIEHLIVDDRKEIEDLIEEVEKQEKFGDDIAELMENVE